MKTLGLQRVPDQARPARGAPAPPAPEILAQRRSTFGQGGGVAAPPILDAGRPLDATTRGTMESGFGRTFADVRVHDDALAHDEARTLGARAYAAGNHLVFGEGSYRPETSSGQALIAHELAHSVQQSGLQMKVDGPLPAGADAELEAQADRAALDVTAGRTASGLSAIGRPAVYRAEGDPRAAPEAKTAEAAGPSTDLPSDVEVIEETPKGSGATLLVVALPLLTLPRAKGKGAWVQQGYSAMAAGNRLIFSPIFDGKSYETSSSIKAFMEKPAEKYKDIWLNNYGFTSLKGLGRAIRDTASSDPEVEAAVEKPGAKNVVDGLVKGTLPAAKCDIDHVVEKQLGGTSVPSNLQLLVSSKNQESGRETYRAMVAEVKRILEPNRRKVTQFQIRFKDAKVPDDDEDGSFVVETMLRSGKVKGSAAVIEKGEGTPVQLLAGGTSETVRVRASGVTPIDTAERRLIPGMKLINYRRGPGSSPTKGTDTIEAELASKPILKGDRNITLLATIAPAPTTPDPSAGGSAAEKAAATEVRKLTLEAGKNKEIPFYYPYLSRGKLTTLHIDDGRNLSGEGVITPSLKFLGELKVAFGPNRLDLVQTIDSAAINSSAFIKPVSSVFRFTSGSLGLDLVKFKPEGRLEFELGPKGKPVILGAINATEEGGNLVALGTLRPGGSVPGISSAKGEVSYRSDTGWSGLLEATSASIPKSVTTVKLGFREEKGGFHAFGEGGLSTTIRDANLDLKVRWHGAGIEYRGAATFEKPLPLVDKVRLVGSYAGDLLILTGDAQITWKSINATMTVTYRRKDGEDGKFSGKAGVDVRTDKASGHLDLSFDEAGNYWGKGEVSYQVTKDIRPKFGLKLTRDRRVKALGEVALANIALTKMWPSPNGGKLTFIKGIGVKFTIPTGIPAVTVFGRLTASAGLGYGVGPVMLTGLSIKGELYPLEDDPKINAHLTGRLAVPAYGEIYGKFGATIGAEVALGLVSAEGGVEVTPALRVTGEGGLKIDADYAAGTFTFEAEAYAKGQMIAKLDIDLVATLSGAWGLASYTWNHHLKHFEKPIGPELKVTLGKIAYGKGGEITWPSISQIKVEPEHIDPIEIVKDLVSSNKASKH